MTSLNTITIITELSRIMAVARTGDAAELVELLEPLTSTAEARLGVAKAIAELLAQDEELLELARARLNIVEGGPAELVEILERGAGTAEARHEFADTLIRRARSISVPSLFGLPAPDSLDGEFIRAALTDDFFVGDPYVARFAEPGSRAAIVGVLREHTDAMVGMFRGRGVGPVRLPEHPKLDDFLEAAAAGDFETVDDALRELEDDRSWRRAVFQIFRLGLDSLVLLHGIDRSELAAHYGVLLEDLAESSAGVAGAG